MNEREIAEFRKKNLRPLNEEKKIETPAEKPATPVVAQNINEEQGGNGITDADLANKSQRTYVFLMVVIGIVWLVTIFIFNFQS